MKNLRFISLKFPASKSDSLAKTLLPHNSSSNGCQQFIEINPLESWETEHVNEWIGYLQFLPVAVRDSIVKVTCRGNVNGEKLLTTVESFRLFKKIFTTEKINEVFLKALFSLVHTLIKKKGFSKTWTVVFCKVFDTLDVVLFPHNERLLSEALEFTDLFSNVTEFYNHFFSFFADFFEYFEANNKLRELKKARKKKIRYNEKKKLREAQKLEFEVVELEDVAVKKYKKLMRRSEGKKMKGFGCRCGIERAVILDDRKKKKRNNKRNKKSEESYSFPVKIIITELFDEASSPEMKLHYNDSSKFGSIKFSSETFGNFHTAISVGPWYLEFTESGIVVPKKSRFSTKSVISADVDSCHTVYMKIEEVATKICSVVHKWNTTMTYGKCRTEKSGNCQNFIDDIFEALKIDPDELFNGVMGDVIKETRKTGECDCSYLPSESIREILELGKKERVYFSSHGEIDEFVKNVIFPNYSVELREDFQLLKAFDRAFWLRNMKFPEKRYQPLKNEKNVEECPFGDPRITII